MTRCKPLGLALALLAIATGSARAQVAQEIQGAIARIQAQDFEGAVEIIEPFTRANPENSQAWGVLGFSLRSLQRYDEALAAYRTAAELPGAQPGTLYNLGLTLALAGRPDEAIEVLAGVRESGGFEVTQIDLSPAAAILREHPRYAELFPSDAEFADPFVEPVRIIHEWRGESVNDQFGWIARAIGDVDGDGVTDVTTSAPTLQIGGGPAGRIYAYSGRTGARLWTADGEAGDQLGLGINPAGDVDGDGTPDVVAGAPGADEVLVFAGRTGELIRTFQGPAPGESFGQRVIGVGDADGDGHSDVLVGAPGGSPAGQGSGRAYLVSGRDGSTLLTLDGAEAGDGFGSAVGGRTTSDGVTTLVVGAPNAGAGDRGVTYVHKGLSTEPAFVIESDENGAQLGGMFVSAVGDVDADGVVDVYASDFSAGLNGPGSGRAYVHSGADGRRLFDFHGEAGGDGFGIGIADAGDVNGDGHADLLIGAWQHRGAAVAGGKVYLYSGADGSLLREITGKVMGETWGFDTTGVGDVDGDGSIDFLVTSAWSAVSGGRSGRMFIVSGR